MKAHMQEFRVVSYIHSYVGLFWVPLVVLTIVSGIRLHQIFACAF